MLWIIIRAMRITPACAGRSGKRCPVATGKRDHPRVRGEKCVWFDRSHAIGGTVSYTHLTLPTKRIV